jgi:8-amino-7-oxononanoate synthase
MSAHFRATLLARGAPIVESEGPIIPWHVGDAERAVSLSDRLAERGLFVQAIRPPTVAAGTSRLRLTLHARLSDTDIERAIDCLSAII